MAKQYVLKTLLDFASAHRLHGYPGDCSQLHGHNWKIEVEVIGTGLNDIGMVIDFKEIKKQTKIVIQELDHTYLNDHPYFQNRNPTAENIAEFLFESIQARISSDAVSLHRITVWENDRNCVIYSQTEE